MYLVERDLGVTITNVTITAAAVIVTFVIVTPRSLSTRYIKSELNVFSPCDAKVTEYDFASEPETVTGSVKNSGVVSG